MHRMMPPKATHVARSVVCLSVCLSVCLYVWHKGEPCRTSEPIEMRFGGRFAWAQATVHYTESGPRGVYIGATWRIRLNDPCAVETRPSGFFSQLHKIPPFLSIPLPSPSLSFPFRRSLFSLSLSPSVSALLPLPSIQPEWSRLAADQQLSDIVVT